MQTSSASVFITKLEAARRQIDAAIRMTFAQEDELAVHTVAAAAYNILRDIKKHRKRSELADAFSSGLFGVAKDYLIARALNPATTDHLLPGAERMIQDIADGIDPGLYTSPADIR